MKTIAIHSHKGGVGKTTIALLLAKQAAASGSKVCVADFDFIGSGMTNLFALQKKPRHYLDYYFLEPDPYDFEIDQLLGSYTDRELGKRNLRVMCNLGDGLPGESKKNGAREKVELRSEMVGLMANELRYREIQGKTEILHRKLEESGFDLLVIDCHPGLGFVSETVRPLTTLDVYVTTPHRSDCFGLLKSVNVNKELDDPMSFLIVNMALPQLIDARSFQRLVESDGLVGTEAQALFPHLEYLGQKEEHFAALPESDLLRTFLYLGGTGKLPPISSELAEFAFIPKVLALVAP